MKNHKQTLVNKIIMEKFTSIYYLPQKAHNVNKIKNRIYKKFKYKTAKIQNLVILFEIFVIINNQEQIRQ
jgi:hypothetical protein